ncbi:MAG: PspA-associated protein PspAB [Egibacteraceae bacterium]
MVRWLDTMLGRTRPKQADLDALFRLTSAAMTLEAATGLRSSGEAAVSFKPASGQGFSATGDEMAELVRFGAEQSDSEVRVTDDEFGYRWIVLSDPDMEDLVTTIHLANSTLSDRGFGSQLLCSVFGFTDGTATRPCHLVYLYKRGTFYPFAPRDGRRRDNELELQVRSAVSGELPIEADLTRWFALWGLPLGS